MTWGEGRDQLRYAGAKAAVGSNGWMLLLIKFPLVHPPEGLNEALYDWWEGAWMIGVEIKCQDCWKYASALEKSRKMGCKLRLHKGHKGRCYDTNSSTSNSRSWVPFGSRRWLVIHHNVSKSSNCCFAPFFISCYFLLSPKKRYSPDKLTHPGNPTLIHWVLTWCWENKSRLKELKCPLQVWKTNLK